MGDRLQNSNLTISNYTVVFSFERERIPMPSKFILFQRDM